MPSPARSSAQPHPDGWVTDSAGLLERAQQTSGAALTPTEPFASTALVVAMPTEAAEALGDDLGWARLLAGPTPVRVPDPNRTTIGRLALGAAAATLDDARLRAAVAGSARAGTATVALDGVAASQPAVGAVVTEAEVTAWNAAHPDQVLAAVAPTEGAAAVEFSLLPVSDRRGDPLPRDAAR